MNTAQKPLTKQILRAALVGATMLAASTAGADLLVGNFSGTDPVVLRYDQSTGASLGVFVPFGSGGLTFPLGGTYGPDKNLYVSNSDGDNVLRYNGNTGAFMNEFAPNVEDAAGSAFGPNGNLYVANASAAAPGSGSVTELDGTTGAFIATIGLGDLSAPEGIAFGPDGNLYVANVDDSDIVEFNGTTGALIGVFASGNGLSHPRDLTFGPDGNLYVTNFSGSTGAVLRFNGTTGAFIDDFVTFDGTNSLPRPLVFGPDGNLYVGYFGNGDVLRYNGTTGAFIDVFVAPGSGGLGGPTFLLFHDISTGSAPEPSSLVLLATGLGVALTIFRRRDSRH